MVGGSIPPSRTMEGFSLLQAVRYALTSVSTFCFNLFLVWLFASVFNVFYLVAVVAGFAAETTALYLLNRLWTFRGVVRTTPAGGYIRAWCVALSTLGLILTIEWLLVSFAGVNYLAARILVAPVAYIWSYIFDGVFTFKALRFIRQ